MNTRQSKHTAVLSALACMLILGGCRSDTPESMITSAKSYLEKKDDKAAVIQLKNALQSNPELAEARFLLGQALLDGGNPTGAEVELRKAMTLKYPLDQVAPLLARTMLLSGQAKKVVDEFTTAQLVAPEAKADLLAVLGQAQLNLGKPDAAKEAFAQAVSLVPEHAGGLLGLARIKANEPDLPGALTLLDESLKKNPGFYEALLLKGVLLTAQGHADTAEETFRQAIAAKPDYAAAYSALIGQLLEREKLDAAEKELATLKKLAPTHPQTTYLQAQVQYRRKDFKAALESIQQHLKFAPESPLGLQLAGAIEFELASYASAENYLLKALPNTPELGLARRMLVATYLRMAQPAKAMTVLQPVLDKMDNDSNMLALAGDVFMQNGDVDKASEYFAKAVALDPENPRKQTSVALLRLAKGDEETAYRELAAIAARDSGTGADMALITAQLRHRRFDAALKAIDALEKKQPDGPQAHQLRGVAMLGKGDAASARKSFELAIGKDPLNFPSAAALASLDLADNKPEDARKRFETILAKDAKNLQAMMALAELRAKTGGQTVEVADLLTKAINANPSQAAPRLALIALYLSANDSKKAVAAAQDALGVLPDSIEVLDAAGRAQQLAGDLQQALVTYGKISTLRPDAVMPYLRMAEINVAAQDKDAAMQSLRKALSVKADSIEAQRGIMMLDLDAGRVTEAIDVARQVQKQRPKEAAGYILEGDAYALKKAWNEAIAAYRVGLKQTGSSELAVKLHAALVTTGAAAEAGKFAEGWVKDHAKDMVFRLHLAESANARKDHAAAVAHYRVLVEAQPNNAAMLNNLAWNLVQVKDEHAVDFAERAYQLAPAQPAILDTLGIALMAKGDTARGLELLQKASAAAPREAAIRLDLAQALIKVGQKAEAKKELQELAKLGDKFDDQAVVAKLLRDL